MKDKCNLIQMQYQKLINEKVIFNLSFSKTYIYVFGVPIMYTYVCITNHAANVILNPSLHNVVCVFTSKSGHLIQVLTKDLAVDQKIVLKR